MKSVTLLLMIVCCYSALASPGIFMEIQNDTPLIIRRCNDFPVSGRGDHSEWKKTKWISLNQIDKFGKQLETKFKILYSSGGIYVLFNGQDEKITSGFNNDFEDLYNADVFEVFFHTDISEPLYFEYEVSPLGKELVLLISNKNGNFGRWMPWHYEEYRVIKKVTVNGGTMKHGSSIKGWTAELFFPFTLLKILNNVSPKPGTRWNANFCRLDYDSGNMVKWSWSPILKSFHEYEKYFSVQFE